MAKHRFTAEEIKGLPDTSILSILLAERLSTTKGLLAERLRTLLGRVVSGALVSRKNSAPFDHEFVLRAGTGFNFVVACVCGCGRSWIIPRDAMTGAWDAIRSKPALTEHQKRQQKILHDSICAIRRAFNQIWLHKMGEEDQRVMTDEQMIRAAFASLSPKARRMLRENKKRADRSKRAKRRQ